jgi:putative transposase
VARFSRAAAHACLSGHNLPCLGAELINVGGVADHVHIVTTLPRTLFQADLIEQIKSSKWIKTLDARYRGFSGNAGTARFR